MNLEEKMFSLIETWQESGLSKSEFLSDKAIGQAKFNYWLHEYHRAPSRSRSNLPAQHSAEDFKSFVLSEREIDSKRPSENMEIVTPSGIRITIFH